MENISQFESRARYNTDKKEFVGLVNNYKPSKVMTRNGKKFMEVIPKETFEKALAKNPNVKLYINHQDYVDVSESIELSAEPQGLMIRAKLSEKADNLFKDIKNGEFNSFSFGFKCLKDKWEDTPNDGVSLRTIEDLELVEISILNIEAAYSGTKILETRRFSDNELWRVSLANKQIEIMKLLK